MVESPQTTGHAQLDRGEGALRLVELSLSKKDPDPKALCCYGLLRDDTRKVMLRFVDGRPVSSVTISYLQWVCERLSAEGKRVLVMVWDNASWHVSREVRAWLREHNRAVLAQRRRGERGERREWGTDYSLLAAVQESLAQPHRAEVGAW